MARDNNATLHIVHVEEPPPAYGVAAAYYGRVPAPEWPEKRKALAEVKPTDPKVKCEHHLVTGEPPKALLRFADDNDVDLIVMGTHGRTGLKRLFMGSVAETVVRRAHCPVLTYRPSNKTAEKAETVSA
jgi:nucleotide-binding universal stress UspA family protein